MPNPLGPPCDFCDNTAIDAVDHIDGSSTYVCGDHTPSTMNHEPITTQGEADSIFGKGWDITPSGENNPF